LTGLFCKILIDIELYVTLQAEDLSFISKEGVQNHVAPWRSSCRALRGAAVRPGDVGGANTWLCGIDQAPPPRIAERGGCKTAVAGELWGLSAPAACCPTRLASSRNRFWRILAPTQVFRVGSGPISAFFGAGIGFSSGVGAIIRHFRCRAPAVCRRQRAGCAEPPRRARAQPARTRRAPLPRGAGAFSPDAPLTTNPISNPGGAAAPRYARRRLLSARSP